MIDPITDRRLAILRRRFETMSNVYVGADGCELLDEIDQLRQRVAVLEYALREIAYNTSTSVPLGKVPTYHHADNLGRCIGIAANALAGDRESTP